MTLNFPGPFQLRINYQVGPRPHVHQVNLDLDTDAGVGGGFAVHKAKTRGGTPQALSAILTNYIDDIKPFYNSTDCNFESAELWKYSPQSFDATFHDISILGIAGSAAGATQYASQCRLSGVTSLGGAIFLDFMDTKFAPGETDAAPFADTDVAHLVTFLQGTSNWIIGRDGAYPIVMRKWNPGQNERAWRELNRA